MSDTPIFDSVGEPLTEEQRYQARLRKMEANAVYGRDIDVNSLYPSELTASDAPAWFTIGRRKWAYNVAIAVLLIVTGWQTAQAVTFESWANLITAVLSLGATSTQILARVNVR